MNNKSKIKNFSVVQSDFYLIIYLIPLYRAASEKVPILKIRLKRPLTAIHFYFGLSGKHVAQYSSYESPYA
jgi:hypothetical protein